MSELKTGITIVEITVAVMALLVLGDYLGYKVSRWRLASFAGIVTLVVIVAFAIYAAIVLTQSK